jgi:competence protein ComEA
MVRTLSFFATLVLLAGPVCAQPSRPDAKPAPAQTSRDGAKASSTAPAAGGGGSIVNLNTATAAELAALPGIGPKTADRIIEYRKNKGPFKKIEELMNVQGIGEKSFLKLKPQITVTAGPPAKAGQQ